VSAILRAIIIGVGLALFCGAFAILMFAPRAWPAAAEMLIFSAMLLIFTIFERWRYRRIVSQSPPDFEPTAERFIDPTSGAHIVVDYNERTGERSYREAHPDDRPSSDPQT
jgi:hypothetical protein